MQTVTLSLFHFKGVSRTAWAFGQMGLARRVLQAMPDCSFVKQMGTGTKEGFTPVPNLHVYGIIAAWPSEEIARNRIADQRIFQRYRHRASESWTLYLRTTRATGAWSGSQPFLADPSLENAEPIVVLTRAQVKTRHLLAFWKRAPAISDVIGGDRHVVFKIGLGEVPFKNQVTFSIWPDQAAIKRFAYAKGPHQMAIQAVRDGDWFSEELFARFAVLGSEGTWGGAEKRLTTATEDAREAVF